MTVKTDLVQPCNLTLLPTFKQEAQVGPKEDNPTIVSLAYITFQQHMVFLRHSPELRLANQR
jgi:hypothetical protein